MKRQMKASAVALLVSGCLLALSAAAAANPKPSAEEQKAAAEQKLVEAAKTKEAAQCFDCTTRTNKAMDACSQACPMNDPSKKDAATKCLSKCSDKYHASTATCAGSCPRQSDARTKTPDPSKVH